MLLNKPDSFHARIIIMSYKIIINFPTDLTYFGKLIILIQVVSKTKLIALRYANVVIICTYMYLSIFYSQIN